MRCPKCGTSFDVEAPGSLPINVTLGGAPRPPGFSPQPPKPAPVRDASLKSTMAGIAPQELVAMLSRAGGEANSTQSHPEPAPLAQRLEPVAPRAQGGPSLDLDLDLPSPVVPAELPVLAAPRARSAGTPAAPVGVAEPVGAASNDLPVPVTRNAADLLDLPARKAPQAAPLELPSILDAPSPAGSAPPWAGARAFGDLSLELPPLPPQSDPAPQSAPPRDLEDLPVLASAALPATAGNRGAPSPQSARDSIDLPSPVDAALPSPLQASLPAVAKGSLPSVASASLPSVAGASLPSPATAQGFPAHSPGLPDVQGSIPPWPQQEFGAPSESSSPEISLPEASVPPPPPVAPVPTQPPAEVSEGFELVEPSTVPEVPLDAFSSPAPPAVQAEARGAPNVFGTDRAASAARGAEERPRSRRSLRAFGVVGVLAALGGAALSLQPDLGPFGVHWVLDRVRADEYTKLTADSLARVERHFERDTFSEARAALAELERTRESAKRVRALAAYAAFFGFLQELRFGPDAAVHASSAVLLDALAEDTSEPSTLARAARAASEGQLARARQLLGAVRPSRTRAALEGEVELRARDAKAALGAFGRLAKSEDGARAAYGAARANYAALDVTAAERDAARAVQKNPGHVGARILKARIASTRREDEPSAVSALEGIVSDRRNASPAELVEAHTLLGDIHFARSRISRAEAAYTAAIAVNPRAARALIGLGEALYRAGRYSEAQARFIAGSQADPGELSAEVGVAKSKLKLEGISEAHAMLGKLYTAHPKAMPVLYWYARTLEEVGSLERSEKVLREAIELGKPEDALLVESYIALALLQDRAGRGEDAKQTLATARERLPQSGGIHRALGEVALSHGRYSEAEAEFSEAIRMDPEDLLARFRLGVALRHDAKLEESTQAFEAVSAADPDYPGLALERGLLYEASGRPEDALRAYEGALAKAPGDPDLALRVGCGYAVAGRRKEALTLLSKLLAERPNSAEANYCAGRAVFAEGSRLAEALRYFERAAELEPNKAEYRLYVGWVASESGSFAMAEKSLDEAIRLDKGLADAYAQRGILRARQGLVREAIKDLTFALSLRPTLYEANAALADAYYDSGREALALTEWKKAVSARPDNATWHYRYGKLLAANQMNDAARVELGAALELVQKNNLRERWIPEAHHFMARALGMRPEAVEHWETFLKLGPYDSPYRDEAKVALQRLGKPYTE